MSFLVVIQKAIMLWKWCQEMGIEMKDLKPVYLPEGVLNQIINPPLAHLPMLGEDAKRYIDLGSIDLFIIRFNLFRLF